LEDVDSEEQSVALALESQEEVPARLGASGTAPESPSSTFSTATPDSALRLIREIERENRSLSFAEDDVATLRRTRLVLGAEALLRAVLSPSGEVALAGIEGKLTARGESAAPLERVLSELAVVPDGQMLSRHVGPGIFLIARRGDELVAAAFAEDPAKGERLPIAGWQEDFFGFIAGRMVRSASEGWASGGAEALKTAAYETHAPRRDLPPGMIVGESPALRALIAQVGAIARSDLSVLIVGETGAGKELVARMVHLWSGVAKGPYVAVNCAAIPADLLEAELFGVVRGAATGVEARPGLLASADGGSILLDEIGDMPERLQAKILRVLESGEVQPVGSSNTRRVQVRIIAATNRDLMELVPTGRFRADLFYRLRGVEVHVPPLRERREDIPGLALAFTQRAAQQYQRRIRGISRAALSLLEHHPWPGNVRELDNEIKRAVLLCPNGSLLETTHFAALLRSRREGAAAEVAEAHLTATGDTKPTAPPSAPGPRTLKDHVEATERAVITEALARNRGNRAATARELGVTRNGLAMKILRLGL
jgi:DNA-binding NtrC family response regulator